MKKALCVLIILSFIGSVYCMKGDEGTMFPDFSKKVVTFDPILFESKHARFFSMAAINASRKYEKRIDCLDLSGTKCTDAQFKTCLLQFETIEKVNIRGCTKLTMDSIKFLADSAQILFIKSIDISGMPMLHIDYVLPALRKLYRLSSIEEFVIDFLGREGSHIKGFHDGVKSIILHKPKGGDLTQFFKDIRRFKTLESLSVRKGDLSNVALEFEPYPNVRKLSLYGCKGLQKIKGFSLKLFPNLTDLVLNESDCNDACLRDVFTLTLLKHLQMHNTEVSLGFFKELLFPQEKIEETNDVYKHLLLRTYSAYKEFKSKLKIVGVISNAAERLQNKIKENKALFLKAGATSIFDYCKAFLEKHKKFLWAQEAAKSFSSLESWLKSEGWKKDIEHAIKKIEIFLDEEEQKEGFNVEIAYNEIIELLKDIDVKEQGRFKGALIFNIIAFAYKLETLCYRHKTDIVERKKVQGIFDLCAALKSIKYLGIPYLDSGENLKPLQGLPLKGLYFDKVADGASDYNFGGLQYIHKDLESITFVEDDRVKGYFGQFKDFFRVFVLEKAESFSRFTKLKRLTCKGIENFASKNIIDLPDSLTYLHLENCGNISFNDLPYLDSLKRLIFTGFLGGDIDEDMKHWELESLKVFVTGGKLKEDFITFLPNTLKSIDFVDAEKLDSMKFDITGAFKDKFKAEPGPVILKGFGDVVFAGK